MSRAGMVANDTREPHTVRGPDPRAWNYVAGLDVGYGWALAGHNGAYRGGEGPKLTGGRHFSGDLGPLQRFARGLQGSVTGTLGSLVEGRLPATSTTRGLNPNLQTLLANGGY
ncbi:MAG TPA: hypothetical protein VKQ71_17650 [Acidimicrobiales bacterium]|nr:hypothetical protein [Acidimicrobiales bacterium]